MVHVQLIGAGGYGGIGLVELLLRHPRAQLVALVDVQGVGRRLSDMWPYLEGHCDLPILAPDAPDLKGLDVDLTFCATPDGVGQMLAEAELGLGRKFIDYSGDYRFNSTELYAEYARRLGRDPVHGAAHLLSECVYGLTELHREEIRGARLVGNPGCFAMACIGGLAPAVKEGLVELEGLIADAKTGASGGGKKPSPSFHLPERYENASAYRLSGHQHVMEIERELSLLARQAVRLTFTPQVIPMVRGILATLYGRLSAGMTQARVLEAYQQAYWHEPFVVVKAPDQVVGTADVRGSNRMVMTVACDERTGTFRVVSHIDNLVKGQAGSALQNMNVMLGLEETLGLAYPAMHP
ncbi:N-acetyl-gamma-glutamyl-phosphate reductase [Myxococcota bacterium]